MTCDMTFCSFRLAKIVTTLRFYLHNPHQRRHCISLLMATRIDTRFVASQHSAYHFVGRRAKAIPGATAVPASLSAISRYYRRKGRLLRGPRIARCRCNVSKRVVSVKGRVKCAARKADKLEPTLMGRKRSVEQSTSWLTSK